MYVFAFNKKFLFSNFSMKGFPEELVNADMLDSVKKINNIITVAS